MFLKVLFIFWMVYGAPVQRYWDTVWSSQASQARLIKEAVLSANQDRTLLSQLQAKAISRKIIRISNCLEIDPILFTALIWRESHFRPQATSSTGAVGLTQLTKPGIHEVLDRLSPESIRKSDSIRQQLKGCYPKVLAQVPPQIQSDDLNAWKKKIAASPELSIVFGAVLFKSYLTADSRSALERYNGDPKVKVTFANDVLALSYWISSSFKVLPESPAGTSKFLVSIQEL